MKKTFKTYKELQTFIDTYLEAHNIKSYNVVASDTTITITWKETKVEQGLNKTQRKEVQNIVDTSINKALVPIYKSLEDINKTLMLLVTKVGSIEDRLTNLENK